MTPARQPGRHIAVGQVWREDATGELHLVTNVRRRGKDIYYVIGNHDATKLGAPQRIDRARFLATHVPVLDGG